MVWYVSLLLQLQLLISLNIHLVLALIVVMQIDHIRMVVSKGILMSVGRRKGSQLRMLLVEDEMPDSDGRWVDGFDGRVGGYTDSSRAAFAFVW